MANKRVLILDEDALVLVVEKEVVRQVDESRGEMTRSEFVNFLINRQLKEGNKKRNYVDKEEFYRITKEIKGFLYNFLDFFLSLELQKQQQNNNFEIWRQKLQALDGSSEEDNEP